jgi:hypothetical protein
VLLAQIELRLCVEGLQGAKIGVVSLFLFVGALYRQFNGSVFSAKINMSAL